MDRNLPGAYDWFEESHWVPRKGPLRAVALFLYVIVYPQRGVVAASTSRFGPAAFLAETLELVVPAMPGNVQDRDGTTRA